MYSVDTTSRPSIRIDWSPQRYLYKGCYRDQAEPDRRALPKRLNSSRSMAKSVDECYNLAKINYDVFALQNDGECWAGNVSTDNYKRYDLISDCTNILGDTLTNRVYEINKPTTTTTPNVFASSSNYMYQGCFKDDLNSPGLSNYYDTPVRNVEECYELTMRGNNEDKTNYDVFALQYGGQCWSGNKLRDSYQKYGPILSNCSLLGDVSSNQVYEIINRPTTTTVPTTTRAPRASRTAAKTEPSETISEIAYLPEIAKNIISSQQVLNVVKNLY